MDEELKAKLEAGRKRAAELKKMINKQSGLVQNLIKKRE